MLNTLSSSGLPPIEKLVGRSNYRSWKFAVRTYLEHEDLWECVEGTENDAKKIKRACAKIALSVDKINYVHVENTTTAKEARDNLKAAFEDTGLTRKVGLLRTLVTTRLESSSSVEEYINTIITTAHQLSEAGLKVEDVWVGTLLLAGLPDEYKPMIMGLESSGVTISGDYKDEAASRDTISEKVTRWEPGVRFLHLQSEKFQKKQLQRQEEKLQPQLAKSRLIQA